MAFEFDAPLEREAVDWVLRLSRPRRTKRIFHATFNFDPLLCIWVAVAHKAPLTEENLSFIVYEKEHASRLKDLAFQKDKTWKLPEVHFERNEGDVLDLESYTFSSGLYEIAVTCESWALTSTFTRISS